MTKFSSPVEVGARYTSGYSTGRYLWGVVRPHAGTDWAPKTPGDTSSKVHAVADGIVIGAGTGILAGHSGNIVVIDHGMLTGNGSTDHTKTNYGHLSKILVNKGDKVKAGQVIGRQGATGNVTGVHLHLGVRFNGKYADPKKWLSTKGITPGNHAPLDPSVYSPAGTSSAKVSQNGWNVYTSGTDSHLVAIPHIAGRVRKGDVELIFRDLVNYFDKHVEDLDDNGYENDWGFAYREIRGDSDEYSNHASGTALDLNADKHPMGATGTFSSAKVKSIEKMLDRYEGAVRWGGHYSGRKDEMHFEINVSERELSKIVDRIKGKLDFDLIPAGSASPIKPTGNATNERIQRALRKMTYYNGVIDGINGPMQKAAVKEYQRAQVRPFTLVADGNWGPVTDQHYKWTLTLQRTLNKWKGYNISVDGVHGNVTVRRVKDVQRRNHGGLYKGKLDGWAGPMFCRMLGIPRHP